MVQLVLLAMILDVLYPMLSTGNCRCNTLTRREPWEIPVRILCIRLRCNAYQGLKIPFYV